MFHTDHSHLFILKKPKTNKLRKKGRAIFSSESAECPVKKEVCIQQ